MRQDPINSTISPALLHVYKAKSRAFATKDRGQQETAALECTTNKWRGSAAKRAVHRRDEAARDVALSVRANEPRRGANRRVRQAGARFQGPRSERPDRAHQGALFQVVAHPNRLHVPIC